MAQTLFDQHRATLDEAVQATRTRTHWSAYPELPSGRIYGENARADGEAAFKNALSKPFTLPGDHPGEPGGVGGERSPYGFDLAIRYPRANPEQLTAAATAAARNWAIAAPQQRVGVCLEALRRLNARSFEVAFAVMHTTGQGFMMAFQAGGPHAQDRGLEALACAWDELQHVPPTALWTKQVSKTDSITLRKTYRIVPRGVACAVACSTFPTWNSYPGIFASLATGNAVIVKPHPGAVLPLALTVAVLRDVLIEAGFDPNVVTLAADDPQAPLTQELVTHPAVGIVDYTGSSQFGEWIEANARQAVVFTEKAGINATIIDSVADLDAVTANLAFSLCLYSGQMCTAPQNIFVPRDGILAGGQRVAFDDVAAAIATAVDGLLGEPARAQEVLGAIQNDATVQRVEEAAALGLPVLRASQPVPHQHFPEARLRSPLILRADAADTEAWDRERFGPIAFVIATDGADHALALATRTARTHGAITCGLYALDAGVLARAEEATAAAGVPLSCNLTGPIYVNQAAAFSDFHVSGANPAGNATLTDSAFVAGRYRVVQSRMPATA